MDIRTKIDSRRDTAMVYAVSEPGKKWLSEYIIVNVGLVPWVHISLDALVEYEQAARAAGLEIA